MHAHRRFMMHTQRPDRFWIGTGLMLPAPCGGFPVPAVLLALSDNLWQCGLLFDFKFMGIVVATILLLSLIFWWSFVYHITHALSELTLATESIAEGNFDKRLDSGRLDELGRLAEAVNSMSERLSSFVSGQKRFLGDISHELVSPIARLQVALELLAGSAAPAQNGLIQDIAEEVQEMAQLVDELLAFSKAGLKGAAPPQLVDIHLDSLIGELIERLGIAQRVKMSVPAGLCV